MCSRTPSSLGAGPAWKILDSFSFDHVFSTIGDRSEAEVCLERCGVSGAGMPTPPMPRPWAPPTRRPPEAAPEPQRPCGLKRCRVPGTLPALSPRCRWLAAARANSAELEELPPEDGRPREDPRRRASPPAAAKRRSAEPPGRRRSAEAGRPNAGAGRPTGSLVGAFAPPRGGGPKEPNGSLRPAHGLLLGNKVFAAWRPSRGGRAPLVSNSSGFRALSTEDRSPNDTSELQVDAVLLVVSQEPLSPSPSAFAGLPAAVLALRGLPGENQLAVDAASCCCTVVFLADSDMPDPWWSSAQMMSFMVIGGSCGPSPRCASSSPARCHSS
mmetsp:Transcript_95452/g.275604  ORF Transcript_95452/g.275604 Transcript_95452/m.275604 type:complete len:327 (-) Transcript_95452:108-1088(-)